MTLWPIVAALIFRPKIKIMTRPTPVTVQKALRRMVSIITALTNPRVMVSTGRSGRETTTPLRDLI